MRKILASTVMLALLAIFMTPVSTAAESASVAYEGSAGYYAGAIPPHGQQGIPTGRGLSLVWHPCAPDGCDFNGDYCADDNTCVPVSGLPIVPNAVHLGGGHLTVTGTYSNVIISVSDDIYGSNAANSACFWNPDGDNICFGEGENADYGSEWACGPKALLGSPFAADYVTVWVQAVMITEDLDVCGGSAGTISGDFF